jgi:hypothetical protein
MLFGHCSVLKRKKSFHTMTSNTSTQTTSSDSFFQKIPKADQITLVTQFLEDEHDSERGKDIMGILAEIQHARLTTISKMPVGRNGFCKTLPIKGFAGVVQRATPAYMGRILGRILGTFQHLP